MVEFFEYTGVFSKLEIIGLIYVLMVYMFLGYFTILKCFGNKEAVLILVGSLIKNC